MPSARLPKEPREPSSSSSSASASASASVTSAASGPGKAAIAAAAADELKRIRGIQTQGYSSANDNHNTHELESGGTVPNYTEGGPSGSGLVVVPSKRKAVREPGESGRVKGEDEGRGTEQDRRKGGTGTKKRGPIRSEDGEPHDHLSLSRLLLSVRSCRATRGDQETVHVPAVERLSSEPEPSNSYSSGQEIVGNSPGDTPRESTTPTAN